MDQYIGEIRLMACQIAPKGWALCDGSMLPIAQHQSLFSLLGDSFGYNGTNFALPDLRGRVPVGAGQGLGLSKYFVGEAAGADVVTFDQSHIPAHTHLVNASETKASSTSPVGQYPAVPNASIYAPHTPSYLHPNAISAVGGQPHPNMQPYTVVNFFIALTGTYPPRT